MHRVDRGGRPAPVHDGKDGQISSDGQVSPDGQARQMASGGTSS